MDFEKRMSQVPDEELLTVISSDGFMPEAVEAAKAELAKRNLKPEELARIESDVAELQRLDEGKRLIPLGNPGKIATFVFGPLLLFSVGAALAFRFRGYRQKSNDIFLWIAISWAFWVGLSSILSFVA